MKLDEVLHYDRFRAGYPGGIYALLSEQCVLLHFVQHALVSVEDVKFT